MAPRTWRQYSPDPEPKGEPAVHERPTRPTRPTRSRLTVIVAAAAVASFVALVRAGTDGDSSAAQQQATPAPAKVAPQTREGFAAMLTALERAQGGTVVTMAALYDDYAYLTVPDHGPGDERAVRYRWDEHGLSDDGKTTTDDQPFDLADYADLMGPELCGKARSLLEGPDHCYLLIEQADATVTGPVGFAAYAGNDYDQTAFVRYDHTGRVLDQYGPRDR